MKIVDKLILGVLVILLVGMSAVFITAFDTADVGEQRKLPTQTALKKITPEEAKIIALRAVPGILQGVEAEKENGAYFYEVEIRDGNLEKEVKIDLQGNILSIETEEEEIAPEKLATVGGIITKEQAIAIARVEVDGRVLEVEAEREGGRLLYAVEIEDGNEIAEVEIDAETGEVLEVELEDEDDED